MTHEPSGMLDELLLDLATIIELSDNDRRIANKRFGLLKTHLERPSSPLRELLLAENALIYAQGSMAIGATIVSGVDDDRFDVDALVDVPVPWDWSDADALDKLEEALQGFPGVVDIVRCTRCVQLQFAFMHMDVTILDPARAPRQERVGEIFHSPDRGDAYRVPSNPYGFSIWYRSAVSLKNENFAAEVRKRRTHLAFDRLASAEEVAKVEQENLPTVVPPRLDAQQVVALKLMKRFVNLWYCKSDLKRPPSIYLTKASADCGYAPFGLTSQLEQFAARVRDQMFEAHSRVDGPHEVNPSYPLDKINDRWPTSQKDRAGLVKAMDYLLAALKTARSSSISDIRKALSDVFGERFSTKAYEALAAKKPTHFVPGVGTILTGAVPVSTSRAAPIPAHRFHSEVREEK